MRVNAEKTEADKGYERQVGVNFMGMEEWSSWQSGCGKRGEARVSKVKGT